MRRLVYFLSATQDYLEGNIKSFTRIMREAAPDNILFDSNDCCVLMFNTNGYVIRGAVYDGSTSFISQLGSRYDNIHVVIERDVTDIETLGRFVEMLYKEHRELFSFARIEVTVVDSKFYLDNNKLCSSWPDNILGMTKFLVKPETDKDGCWLTEISSSNYLLGNLIWHIYGGRYHEIENLCFSERRDCVFAGELLVRCFGLEEIDACL